MKRRTIFQSLLALFFGSKVKAEVSPWPPILKTVQFFPETNIEDWNVWIAHTENITMRDGRYVSVHPSDNHAEHIRIHSEYALENDLLDSHVLRCHIHVHSMMEAPK